MLMGILQLMNAATTCSNPLCLRLSCTGDCHAPVHCSDCGRELTAEEELEERAAVRPQCFGCIDKAWEATEKKIRARTMLPPAPRPPEHWACVCGATAVTEDWGPGTSVTYVECGCSRRMQRVPATIPCPPPADEAGCCDDVLPALRAAS